MTHKLLQRQLKRQLGIADDAQLLSVLGELDTLAQVPGVGGVTQLTLRGIRTFLQQVDESYVQSERALELSTRSLELSSTELSQANESMRAEVQQREHALQTLRDTANQMLKPLGQHIGADAHSLDRLTILLSELVQNLIQTQQSAKDAYAKLKNQQFALDQHAIVSITNPDGIILYANDRFCEISKMQRHELVGQSHRIVNSGYHDNAFFTEMWNTISAGKVWHGEVCNRASDDSTYWVAATVVPFLDAHGLPYEYIAMRTDISARKAGELTLLRAKEAAESASRAKSDFLATMSHEIRTPMNGIIGMTALTLDTELDAEQREYLGLVKESADHLLTIINDILDFSKIESGKMELETVTFDVATLLADTAKLLRVQARAKGLFLTHELGESTPHNIMGDPGRLRQVWINLLGNAIKFTERGTVSVRVSSSTLRGNRVRLHTEVADQGIGIPADMQVKIFEAFTQADNTTTRRYGGTGLGLAICTQLVAAMGGKLTVNSEIGVGSVFSFDIDVAVSATDLESTAGAQLAGLRVLMVDDTPTNLRILAQTTRKWGMLPSTATNAAEALELVRLSNDEGAPFDLIILDAMMPQTDGFELARQLGTMPQSDSAIMMMLSSDGMRGDASRCRELGISAYLTKPIDPQELHSAVQRAILANANTVLITRHNLTDPAPSRHLHILLAEDNPVNQKLAVTLLSKWGHQVEVAHNGQQAVDLAAQTRFDLILMDVQMPIMGGWEATQVIRQRESGGEYHQRIVAMTANAMSEDRQRCLDAGMDDYIAKPIQADALRRIVEGLNEATVMNLSPPPAAAFNYAQALAESDAWIIETIGQDFLDDCPVQLDGMARALAAGDHATLVRHAHTLRGLVANFQARPVEELAGTMESLPAAELDSAADLLARLVREAQKMNAALAQYLAELGSSPDN